MPSPMGVHSIWSDVQVIESFVVSQFCTPSATRKMPPTRIGEA